MRAASAKFSPAMCTWLPWPAEPKLSVPGFALASAISSCTFVAGTEGCTTTTMGPVATLVTGVSSFMVKPAFLCRLTLIVMAPDVSRMV